MYFILIILSQLSSKLNFNIFKKKKKILENRTNKKKKEKKRKLTLKTTNKSKGKKHTKTLCQKDKPTNQKLTKIIKKTIPGNQKNAMKP